MKDTLLKATLLRVLVIAAAGALTAAASLIFLDRVFLDHVVDRVWADAKPSVELNVDQATPRQVDDLVQQTIVRDYTLAWQAMANALNSNNTAALGDNFVGFAQEKITHRIHDQKQAGLTTRIVDHGHKLDAVFYSIDGAAMELRDTANIETQILDGDTVLHSDRAQVHFYVVMTGAEDRWKVRVLESAE